MGSGAGTNGAEAAGRDAARGNGSPAPRPARTPRAPKAPRAWQRMLSGRRLDLLNPSALDVEIADVAHGLARVARWNGQTRGDEPYTVAQHALLVEALAGERRPGLGPEPALVILLHDAAEYVVGDMISPLKAALAGDYREVESRVLGAVFARYGLPEPSRALAALLKAADRAAAHHEAVRLAGFTPAEARAHFGPLVPLGACAAWLDPRPARDVQAAFLARFDALMRARAEALPRIT